MRCRPPPGSATGQMGRRHAHRRAPTHVKTAWIRRGNGIPGSDQSTYTVHITRHDDLLTLLVIQEDPIYSDRAARRQPRVAVRSRAAIRADGRSATPRTRFHGSRTRGIVPHYLPGQNPEADFMTRTYNLPKEAALGSGESLYPEYRRKLKSLYTPPAACGRYCCGLDRASGPATAQRQASRATTAGWANSTRSCGASRSEREGSRRRRRNEPVRSWSLAAGSCGHKPLTAANYQLPTQLPARLPL